MATSIACVTAKVPSSMATGRNNKIVGQTGEYLVAAELGRRGLIATTFTGNVPHYDIVASDEDGRHVSVQVKAIRGGSWQFANISNYCTISFASKQQIVGKAKPCPIERLVMVFVKVDDAGEDRFYVLTWQRLRDLLIKEHKNYLAKHNGIRPKRWDSLHCAITEKVLARYQDNWDLVFESLR